MVTPEGDQPSAKQPQPETPGEPDTEENQAISTDLSMYSAQVYYAEYLKIKRHDLSEQEIQAEVERGMSNDLIRDFWEMTTELDAEIRKDDPTFPTWIDRYKRRASRGSTNAPK